MNFADTTTWHLIAQACPGSPKPDKKHKARAEQPDQAVASPDCWAACMTFCT